MRPDDGGGEFVGVDPQLLGDLISSVSGASEAQPVLNGWLSQAGRCGIDTSRLTAIGQSLSWAQGQLPMLQRRQGLAFALVRQDPQLTGPLPAGGGPLGNFPTDAAAAQAAMKDARAFTGGSLSTAALYQKMAANTGDPAYDTALIKALGADWVRQLEQDAPLDPVGQDGQDARSVMAVTVATAMWNGVTLPEPGYEPGIDGAVGKEDPSLLAPLLQDASFPPRVLADLGTACLAPGEYSYGNQVWRALAASPAGATLFVHDNIGYLPQWMAAGSDHQGGLPDFQAAAFAGVIQAGTTGGQDANAVLAAQNATGLIQYYATHAGAHTHPEIQAAFDHIVAHYWADVQHSITDPAPVSLGPGHVSVPAAQWEAFISEGMRNPDAGARLLTFSGEQAYQLETADPHNPAALHAAGVIQGFFGQTALNTYKQLMKETNSDDAAWKSTFTGQLNTALSTGVDVALNPGGAASTIAKAGVKDLISIVVNDLPSQSRSLPPPPPAVASWRTDWTNAAATAYQSDHTLGDWQHYAALYTGGKPFLTGTGSLVDPASPQQMNAYNAWLQDPKVASAIASDKAFDETDLGRQDGEDMAGRGS